MKARSNVSPIISIQGNNTVSATKAIIETQVAEKSIRTILREKLKILQQDSITQWKKCQI